MGFAIQLLSGTTLLFAGMLFTLYGDNVQTRLMGNIVVLISIFQFLATFGVLK
jgi:DNA-binding transcriptional regulator PaaX